MMFGRSARLLLAAWSAAAVRASRLDASQAAASEGAAGEGFNPAAPLLGGLLGAARHAAPEAASSTALGALLRRSPGVTADRPSAPTSSWFDQWVGLDVVPGRQLLGGKMDWDLVPEAVIDNGSTAVIWSARYTEKGEQGQPVAVKLLRTWGRQAVQSVKRERVMREVDIMSRFSGGPFLQYYGWWAKDDSILIVMERAEGNLFRLVLDKPSTEVTLETKVRLMVELLEGLEVMEADGFVHRSIWPRNLMIVRDELGDMHLKIGDFGSACALPGGTKELLLADIERKWVTSSTYDAPESYNITKPVRADVYAAGLIFYQMLFMGMYPPGFPRRETLREMFDPVFMKAWRSYSPSEDPVLIRAEEEAEKNGDVWLPQVLDVLKGMLDPSCFTRMSAAEARKKLAGLTRNTNRIQATIREVLKKQGV